jgi:hypothetical protein
MKTLLAALALLTLSGCSVLGTCATFEECRQIGEMNGIMAGNRTRTNTVQTTNKTYIITTTQSAGATNTRITTVPR